MPASLGADYIATGHYVRKQDDSEHCYLLKGSDDNKDQSYFLCALNEEQLAQSLFPVGELDQTASQGTGREARTGDPR